MKGPEGGGSLRWTSHSDTRDGLYIAEREVAVGGMLRSIAHQEPEYGS